MLDKLKTFLSDKTTLLMTLVGAMFVVFNLILVFLQINTVKSVAITRYNAILLPEFNRGDTRSLYVFALSPLIFFAIHMLIAVRMYERNTSFAKIILSLGYVILLFGIIVSSAVISINK